MGLRLEHIKAFHGFRGPPLITIKTWNITLQEPTLKTSSM